MLYKVLCLKIITQIELYGYGCKYILFFCYDIKAVNKGNVFKMWLTCCFSVIMCTPADMEEKELLSHS